MGRTVSVPNDITVASGPTASGKERAEPAHTGPPPGRGPVLPSRSANCGLAPLAGRVVLLGGTFGVRQETNADAGLEHGWRMLEAAGLLANFNLAAGARGFGYSGDSYADSDVYKWLEAVRWQEQRGLPEPVAHAAADVVDLLDRAQLPDGYLNTYVQVAARSQKWAPVNRHEFYNLGHLIQAGIADARSGGSGRLFEIARRAADQLERACTGKANAWHLGHPGIEMSLTELYRTSGERRYLDLAARLLEFRGERKDVLMGSGLSEWEDVLLPMPWQGELTGHAVCAAYLAAGMTDLLAELDDKRLEEAISAKWQDMVLRKAYLTGNIGSRHAGEAVGTAYELPSGRAYCETCAGIGLMMWCWRLLLLKNQPVYADYFEKLLYNAVLCGVGLDGKRFFYANPLEDDGALERSPWYRCPCCPTNVMRLLAQLEHYVATQDASGVQVQQYTPAQVTTALGHAGAVSVSVATQFPVDGDVALRIDEPGQGEWELSVRVPGWCVGSPRVVLNGEAVDHAPTVRPGYVALRRRWSKGDQLQVGFGMSAGFVEADWRSHDQRGMVAVVRGPVVYCAEGHDQADGHALNLLQAEPDRGLVESRRGGALGDHVVLGARARRLGYPPDGPLYRAWQQGRVPAAHAHPADEEEDLVLLPYYLWANRGRSAMRVWFDVGNPHLTPREMGGAGAG